ncbi:D-alanine transaminase [Pseudorhizobium tarimense]|uniref:Probable branched-chain-amino-acid aminotransferase n=1 Tax=Pseudorhizobium tarimense TaxID=1079109 RepID=A0ABV2HD98_9HYPH|nr:D-amino-acid transaminase [Pseudorhizobium tarimense]MCJ8521512.1 D-amino-acid transaminase [Pseudorhizobium tarimense]
MTRTIYLNGSWVDEADAKVSVFDRGFLFADAIYEVTAVIDGKLIDYAGHAARLRRSLDALRTAMPVSEDELLELHKDIARRNGIKEGLIYLQITRGVQDRDFVFPPDMQPTVVMFTQQKRVLDNPKWKTGLALQSVAEGRWSQRQIKTVQLLYSSLMKTEAHRQGYDDVLFVEDGYVTEASSANFHIVTPEGAVVTRDLSNALLHGITRGSILDLAQKAGLAAEERLFTLDEAKSATEAFLTSATSFVTPVVSLDGNRIGTGEVGPVSRRLLDVYIRENLERGVPVAG